MNLASPVKTVILALESPELREMAEAFQRTYLPQATITETDMESFADLLLEDEDPETQLVLAINADENGSIAHDSPMARQVMMARSPVLVLRQAKGTELHTPRLERIVVPLDGSATAGQAVPIASRIAALSGMPVEFVMVIDPERVLPPGVRYDPESWEIIEELRTTAHWALTQAEDSLRANNIDVHSSLFYGPLTNSLLDSISDNDLIVMTTHGLDRSRLRTPDSVTLEVLCRATQPMITMRAQHQADVVEACRWVPEHTPNRS